MNLKKIFGYAKKMDYAYKVLGILRMHGYFKSIGECKPIDSKGDPIPWYTYPTLEFLEQFDYKNKKVFEWGSGYSSMWWGRRAKKVVSAEKKYNWYKEIKQKTRNLVCLNVIYCAKKSDYLDLIRTQKEKYDIIIIDGEFRDECSKIAPKYLKRGGIIILDNSDWHRNIARKFTNLGFFQIDFKGFGPLLTYTWATSVFIKKTFSFQCIKDQPSNPIGFIDPKVFI